MNLNLTRSSFANDGVFGIITDSNGVEVCKTLEHAYLGANSYAPKLPVGIYKCQRSMHRLHGMTHDFETFQIMDVPGHSNILFHWGNFNRDSDGCVLVGKATILGPNGDQMLINSRTTFKQFMDLQTGIDSFMLTVL